VKGDMYIPGDIFEDAFSTSSVTKLFSAIEPQFFSEPNGDIFWLVRDGESRFL
jgi:hypothetical protein